MKYKKKPVIIDAIEWNGKNFNEISYFTNDWHGNKLAHEDAEDAALKSGKLFIHTLEGVMTASKGDFIIKGIAGEFYPCKEDIFLKTYESVD